jgi:hypothetical protein
MQRFDRVPAFAERFKPLAEAGYSAEKTGRSIDRPVSFAG